MGFRGYYGFLVFFMLAGFNAFTQKRANEFLQLVLPDTLRSGAREISGLAISDGRLYFLAENRNDRFKDLTAGIYSVALDEVEANIKDPARSISGFEYHPVSGIANAIKHMEGYQGLEALVLQGDRFFVSVETEEYADNCYLIGGSFSGGVFQLDTAQILALGKPVLEDGGKVFNASFEALGFINEHLYALFEYNGFAENFAYRIGVKNLAVSRVSLEDKISFRITDAAKGKGRMLVGINYFFPLKAEAIYQKGLSGKDRALVEGRDGKFHAFARLAVFKVKRRRLKIRRYIEVPNRFWTSNWEGIASYANGFLMVNDKFVKDGRHETQLIFLPLGKRSVSRFTSSP